MIIPNSVQDMLRRVLARYDAEATPRAMAPRPEGYHPMRIERRPDARSMDRLWSRLMGRAKPQDREAIADDWSTDQAATYGSNIENYIGTVRMPVGVVGPIRVTGVNANGDYFVPLATTEAALVASYARGALATGKAGGITTAVLYEGVMRTPAFVLDGLLSAGQFTEWVVRHADQLKARAETTTRHGKLVSLEPFIDNNVVFLICRYTTGDAAGQNMVTLATDALCRMILAECPVPVRAWYVEGSFSGDKKATSLGMVTGRGRKVSASVTLPGKVVRQTLRCSAEALVEYARIANLGAQLSGQHGVQAHYANGLAALYIATGQDAACVSESAVGITRIEPRGDDLWCSVTMPNILVGTVGGGTGLPTQQAALNILGLRGPGHAEAFAEVTAALCLCGELSILSALAAGHFASAHDKLARQR